MYSVVAKLEPRREEADVLLIDELDEFLECLMFISGHFKCGYCLNRKQIWVIPYKKPTVIGLYGLTFHKRAKFIYKTINVCKGVFIRKKAWKEILELCDHELKYKL